MPTKAQREKTIAAHPAVGTAAKKAADYARRAHLNAGNEIAEKFRLAEGFLIGSPDSSSVTDVQLREYAEASRDMDELKSGAEAAFKAAHDDVVNRFIDAQASLDEDPEAEEEEAPEPEADS